MEQSLKPKKYLNNKDLLVEIHKSKNNYSSYTLPEYHEYDIILQSVNEINNQTLLQAKLNRAKKISQLNYEKEKAAGNNIKIADCEIDSESIQDHEIIFRIMTYDHIPEDNTRKKNPKTVADKKVKLNFPPYQHWKYDNDKTLRCVGKSHWVGGIENGHFSCNHGKPTNKLAQMWMKLVERYATRGNVRGYSYNDEMIGQAILQLSQIGLKFDESKSSNPFAYYSTVCTNSFIAVINQEKRNQNIRDDILEMNNLTPSNSRLNENEWESSIRER